MYFIVGCLEIFFYFNFEKQKNFQIILLNDFFVNIQKSERIHLIRFNIITSLYISLSLTQLIFFFSFFIFYFLFFLSFPLFSLTWTLLININKIIVLVRKLPLFLKSQKKKKYIYIYIHTHIYQTRNYIFHILKYVV